MHRTTSRAEDDLGSPSQGFDPSHTGLRVAVRGWQSCARPNLSSSWDIAWSPAAAGFVIAMAGNRSIWTLDLLMRQMRQIAGTMNEA